MSRSQNHALTPQNVAFEELNMQVGMRLQLLTHRSVKPATHFSALIGYVKDEYMIVKLPTDDNGFIGLNVGERITIRVFSGMNVCSFACTVERVFERPHGYVHLTFPRVIHGTSLRGAMRVRAEIPVQVRGELHPDSVLSAMLGDISVAGARIQSSLPLPEDEQTVQLEFTLTLPPDQRTLVQTRASVKNLAVSELATPAGDAYSYGVQFIDLDPMHYTLLQNMTYEALLTFRGKIV